MNSGMDAMNREELWGRLQQQSLAEGDLPPVDADASPWYVRVMLGVAGWIGALFLLGFVGVGFSFVMKSTAPALIVGALGCVAAYAIFHAARDNDFAMQFGLAVSLAAQAIFIFGLFNGFRHGTFTLYVLIVVFEATLALLVPNFIHRVLTSAAAAFALSYALSSLGLYGVSSGVVACGLAMIWMDQRRWLGSGNLWRPIGYGLVLALIQIESSSLFGLSMMLWSTARGIGWWVGTAMVTVVLVWAVMRMLDQQGIAVSSKAGVVAMAAAVLVGAVSLVAPGLATAMLILLLGFTTGNRILMGLGLFALLGFLSHYYYQLQTTLLVKSMVLAASGGVLLIARQVLRSVFPITTGTEAFHA